MVNKKATIATLDLTVSSVGTGDALRLRHCRQDVVIGNCGDTDRLFGTKERKYGENCACQKHFAFPDLWFSDYHMLRNYSQKQTLVWPYAR